MTYSVCSLIDCHLILLQRLSSFFFVSCRWIVFIKLSPWERIMRLNGNVVWTAVFCFYHKKRCGQSWDSRRMQKPVWDLTSEQREDAVFHKNAEMCHICLDTARQMSKNKNLSSCTDILPTWRVTIRMSRRLIGRLFHSIHAWVTSHSMCKSSRYFPIMVVTSGFSSLSMHKKASIYPLSYTLHTNNKAWDGRLSQLLWFEKTLRLET